MQTLTQDLIPKIQALTSQPQPASRRRAFLCWRPWRIQGSAGLIDSTARPSAFPPEPAALDILLRDCRQIFRFRY